MLLVDKPEALREAERAVAASEWGALDAEADSLHHYREKLCLFQITVEAGDFVIDPLAGLDLVPIAQSLAKRKRLFLHGADFDLRMMKTVWPPFAPPEIFDTLIAAQVLGYDQQGYAHLVERHCGVKLSKSAQKADWSRRPLDQKLLDYAANDTHYLVEVVRSMETELRELGRLEWHRQSCARLLKSVETPREERVRDGREWQIKGCKELHGKALTVLKAVWYWRDSEAQRRDRPSFKVLNTDILLTIARWAAEHPGQDVGDMPKASSNVRGEHRSALNRVIRDALEAPQAALESAPKGPKDRRRWGNPESRLMDELKKQRDEVAAPLKLHPSLLATNAVLEEITLEKPKTREAFEKASGLLPWQLDLLEERFLKAIASPPKPQ